jgi:hypothetical protein
MTYLRMVLGQACYIYDIGGPRYGQVIQKLQGHTDRVSRPFPALRMPFSWRAIGGWSLFALAGRIEARCAGITLLDANAAIAFPLCPI